LLGTLGHLELKRKEVVGLIFTIAVIVHRHISLAGLLRDVGVDCMGYKKDFQNHVRSGTTFTVSISAGHFGRNL